MLSSILILLWVPSFAADAAAVNPNDIKTLLANCLNTFIINVLLFTGPGSLLSYPLDCTIVDNCVFVNVTLVDELFEKAFTKLSVSNNLYGNFVSSLELAIIFE